jgi:hypothetical protein
MQLKNKAISDVQVRLFGMFRRYCVFNKLYKHSLREFSEMYLVEGFDISLMV